MSMSALEKYENHIMVALYCLLILGFVVLRHDFFYDLNDDVWIKDILVGIYTGSPETRNIQMHYPLSALISGLYRLAPGWAWHGLFLIGCQFFALYISAHAALRLVASRFQKIALLALMLIVVLVTMLGHLIFLQYTVAAAMLAGAALLNFMATQPDETAHPPFALLKANVATIILIVLSFLLRWEMLMLLMPLLCTAGLYKWLLVAPPEGKKTQVAPYVGLLAAIIIGILAGQLAHVIAYSSPQWRSFNAFFNSRVQLYDYNSIPDYENSAAFYDGMGLAPGEVGLLENYNFGLSERINADTMSQVAAHARELKYQDYDAHADLIKNLREYYYLMTSSGEQGHFPYNSLIIIGYAALLLLGIVRRSFKRHMAIALLFGIVRSGMWIYVLMGGRYPPRITHSLYFVEMLLLLAVFLMELTPIYQAAPLSGEYGARHIRLIGLAKLCVPVVFSLAAVIALSALPNTLQEQAAEQSRREDVNQTWQQMQAYTRQRPEDYFFIDVYSSVPYSEPVFMPPMPRPANYDLMGGWAAKSPLYEQKMAHFFPDGVNMQTALADSDYAYFINERRFDPAWLSAYYREQGVAMDLVLQDTINGILDVYKVEVYKE